MVGIHEDTGQTCTVNDILSEPGTFQWNSHHTTIETKDLLFLLEEVKSGHLRSVVDECWDSFVHICGRKMSVKLKSYKKRRHHRGSELSGIQ